MGVCIYLYWGDWEKQSESQQDVFAGLINRDAVDIWGQIILVMGLSCALLGYLSAFPDLHQLDARSSPSPHASPPPPPGMSAEVWRQPAGDGHLPHGEP